MTTIPASAYLGVAAALGEVDEATGALAVLGANVLMIVIGAVATLDLQGRFARRHVSGRKRAICALLRPEVDAALGRVIVDLGELVRAEVEPLERRHVLLQLPDARGADQGRRDAAVA